MEQPEPGQVVTFYSFQGGTGRTMAIANVAWILAAAGKTVLVVDWDLEAPGLHRFLEPFLDVGSVLRKPGVIDILREYEDLIVREPAHAEETIRRLATVDRHTTAVEWGFGGAGQLHILSAGRQNASYSPTPGEQGWSAFFDERHGADFLDALRAELRKEYQYTLIDSPAGFRDMADMCTQHLPDVLVVCYCMSNQAIDGAARTARSVETFARRGETGRGIRILPVAMRVDGGFPAKAAVGRQLAEHAFARWSSEMAPVEIPYKGSYAFEETLATFGDSPGDPESLLSAFERLTEVITSGGVSALAAMQDDERLGVLGKFDRAARLR